jgi:hypothetical protein
MRWWAIVVGAAVVLFTLRQVFQDLFHPSETGSISEFIARHTFRLFRRSRLLLKDAGPLSLVLVICIWATLICFGFALVYWGLPGESFGYHDGTPPDSLPSMIYFSLEMMTTLGLGDLVPKPNYLRLLAAVEAFTGFAVLTASVSSVVLIHPGVARMRTLARTVSLFTRAGGGDGCPGALLQFARDVARARVDFMQMPIIYYFHAENEEASLPEALLALLRMVEERQADGALNGEAALLRVALCDLAELVRERFVDGKATDCKAVFEAIRKQHSIG